jgi:hypothetical protein
MAFLDVKMAFSNINKERHLSVLELGGVPLYLII